MIKNKNKYMNKKKELWKALLLSVIIFAPLQANAQDIEATLLLKQPGNRAVAHQLHLNNGRYEAKGTLLPLQISQTVTAEGGDKTACSTFSDTLPAKTFRVYRIKQ